MKKDTPPLLIIFGASGQVGRLVTAQALAKGYRVLACVHNQTNLPSHTYLQLQKVDIYDQASVRAALQPEAAVISTLGSWGRASKDVVSVGTAHITTAMQQLGLRRLVTLTGAAALTPQEQISQTTFMKAEHNLFQMVAPAILRDGEDHLKTLVDSKLDWTCLRSPAMVNFGSDTYRFSPTMPHAWQTITRPAVAKAMLASLEDPASYGQARFMIRA